MGNARRYHAGFGAEVGQCRAGVEEISATERRCGVARVLLECAPRAPARFLCIRFTLYEGSHLEKTPMTQPIVVAALYKFVTLEDYVALREPCCRQWSTTASKAPC